MRETWYVLEDGSVASPSEVAPDAKGMLRHKSGEAVAMRGDAYSSRSVDVDEEAKKPKKSSRQMKAEEGEKQYKTR